MAGCADAFRLVHGDKEEFTHVQGMRYHTAYIRQVYDLYDITL